MNTKKLLFMIAGICTLSPSWAYTVLVESNSSTQNALLAFDLDNSGKLTAKDSIDLSGRGVVDSTFALGPFDSDQEIITNAKQTLVFAVNSGSNTIAVFQRASNGTLTPVAGSPFASHGINPVSVGLKGNLLTVVNKNEDPSQSCMLTKPNYTTFWVSDSGALTWTGSLFEVEQKTSPSQALISPLASVVFGADFLGGTLRSFELTRSGWIKEQSHLALPDSEFPDPKTPKFPLGLAAHPALPLLYVGFPTASKIGVYEYDLAGALKFVSATADSGAVVCWLLTNRNGTRLYASNTGDSSVTVYDISLDPRNPVELQKIALPSQGGTYQFSLTPDENQLVVLNQRFQASAAQGTGNEIHVLAVDPVSGKLSERESSPTVLHLPGDTRPQGVLVL